jgi:N-acetylglucosaminyldiphosphoundecaprenol N-acetyl-beta-D-mannosaminyltransferase
MDTISMDPITPATIPLLGLNFTNVTLAQTTDHLLTCARAQKFAYVVTPNADHIVRLRRHPELLPLYQRAMLCLLDSQVISLCAAPLGLARPPVVTGADLTAALLSRLHGATVAIIGPPHSTFQALSARYPGIRFLHHAPPMRLSDNQAAFRAACDFACAAQAPFTFIALGSPLQEQLAAAIAERSEGTGIALCIGAALEFCAGTARRAPPCMRRLGLEWLHRLAQDPRRLAPRYLRDDPEIFIALLMAAWRQKALRSPPDRPPPAAPAAISAPGPYPPASPAPLPKTPDAPPHAAPAPAPPPAPAPNSARLLRG